MYKAKPSLFRRTFRLSLYCESTTLVYPKKVGNYSVRRQPVWRILTQYLTICQRCLSVSSYYTTDTSITKTAVQAILPLIDLTLCISLQEVELEFAKVIPSPFLLKINYQRTVFSCFPALLHLYISRSRQQIETSQ